MASALGGGGEERCHRLVVSPPSGLGRGLIASMTSRTSGEGQKLPDRVCPVCHPIYPFFTRSHLGSWRDLTSRNVTDLGEKERQRGLHPG